MKKENIFLTGATGFIGSYLTFLLLKNDFRVCAFVKKNEKENSKDRLLKIILSWDGKISKKNLQNLIIFEGDLTKKNLAFNDSQINFLKTNTKDVFHCAALTDFNKPLNKLKQINLNGTKNLFDLCAKSKNIRKINYLSTAYICGNFKGVFQEKDLDLGQQFNSNYEYSKFKTEELVQKYRKFGLWIDVFRPSLVIGESNTGKILLFKQSFHNVLKLWDLGIFTSLPGKGILLKIVYVDELCKALNLINSKSSEKNQTFHLFPNKSVSLDWIFLESKKFLGLSDIKLLNDKDIRGIKFTLVQKKILNHNLFIYNRNVKLDSRKTNDYLKKLGFKFNYLDRKGLKLLLTDAKNNNYLNQRFKYE